MKIYIEPPQVRSRSIGRIAKELKLYAPSGVDFVTTRDDADLVILHIIGRFHQNSQIAARCLERGQRYVVNQYCLRSTRHRSTHAWRELWNNAAMVWSYYNLNAWIREDGGEGLVPRFYHSPLGADARAFCAPAPVRCAPRFVVGTVGYDWSTESVTDVSHACARADREMFHLGDDPHLGSHITSRTNISDKELAGWYAQCQYVSGLRRVEGFELPCAEGLLCGARPLMFDTPHYRQWFQEFAVLIPETTRELVVERLLHIFKEPLDEYVPVSRDEYEFAKRRFDWATIVDEYWKRCL